MSDILRAVPHRPPMLLIDSVRLLEPSVRILAHRTLHHDDPWFSGHFPGYPVLPGVLIIEALAQAGAVLAAYSLDGEMAQSIPYLVSVEQSRLRKPVHPGQTLDLHVRRDRAWGRFWQLEGEAMVDGEVVATACLKAALMPRSSLPAIVSVSAARTDDNFLDAPHAAA